MFKKLVIYELVAMGVSVAFSLIQGKGTRAGQTIAGFGGLIALTVVAWVLSAAFKRIKSLSKKGVEHLEARLERQRKGQAHDTSF